MIPEECSMNYTPFKVEMIFTSFYKICYSPFNEA